MHSRQIQIRGEALALFKKQHNRNPSKLEANVAIHRPCGYVYRSIDGTSVTCRIASVEHEDKYIGHIFTL